MKTSTRVTGIEYEFADGDRIAINVFGSDPSMASISVYRNDSVLWETDNLDREFVQLIGRMFAPYVED